MKKILILMAILFTNYFCIAQINDFWKIDIKKFLLPSLGSQYKTNANSQRILPTIKFKTPIKNSTTIIILPFDNMPCLVPANNFINQMPVKKDLLPNNMPNPFR